MKKFVACLFLIFTTYLGTAQIKKYIRKASKATEKSDLILAREYYLKAYNLDKTNYYSNLGLGVILSEFMDRHEEAIPYLEAAYAKSIPDTSMDMIYALAKSYHHVGEYQKAIDMYNRLGNSFAVEDDEKLYQMDVKKRKEDCAYGLEKENSYPNKAWYIVNAGSKINTDMAEYVPVINPKNELIFTSRRKDTPDEKPSKLDGKYYESMYLSPLVDGKPQTARRYTLPDLLLKSKFRKHHESIISVSPDNKTLYVYRDNQIFEISVDSVFRNEPLKMPKTVNFDYYQNHAYLTKDGKTLLFTSDADNGLGGIDIYKSVKGSDGTWGKPENLGSNINTAYDEDSPYLTEDEQTLYFASKGHPGYGNYDIYKSVLVNGQWSKPENLKMPINSPAQDIFLVHNEKESGYMASSRKGGFGDMDIYRIQNITKANKECKDSISSLLTVTSNTIDATKGLVSFSVSAPTYFMPLEYQWYYNNNTLNSDSSIVLSAINKDAVNSILSKVVLYCDTCFDPLIACKLIKIGPPVVKTDTLKYYDIAGVNPYDKNLPYTYLSKEKIARLGLNLTPVRFDFNKSNIRSDASEILHKNIEILKEHPEISVLIYGFTDARGTEKYNITLSKNRANHVMDYMKSRGLKSKQLVRAIGKGEEFPINKCVDNVECSNEEHEQNRRVEFILMENK